MNQGESARGRLRICALTRSSSATGEANVVEEATTWAEQMSVQAEEGGMVMNKRWTTNERIGRWVNRHGLGGNETGERSAERYAPCS